MGFYRHASEIEVAHPDMDILWDAKPNTAISTEGQQILKEIENSEYSVLVGRNNCGKSYLLREMTRRLGHKASYLGPSRYQNFNVINSYTPTPNRSIEKWNQTTSYFNDQTKNVDVSAFDLQRDIAELTNTQRASLSEIVELLLGTPLEIKHTVVNNDMSPKYVSCHGHNISFSSSGFRLITTLITSLLDKAFETFLIDEPELGISPEAQGILADFLYNSDHRSRYFSHIKTLVLATHSSIFLDRTTIGNNYGVTKIGSQIDIQRTQSISDFNNIHFFLLGNRLESLYLPACIVLAEGKTDHAYLTRVLRTTFPAVQFSLINATSDGRMKEIIATAGNLLTDLQKSPYRDRIVPVLDHVHSPDVVETLRHAGIPESNIVVWDHNGIEHYYPTAIVDQIYGVGTPLKIDGDSISRNGITHKKWALCEKVVAQINDASVVYPAEFEQKFLGTIRRVCDIT